MTLYQGAHVSQFDGSRLASQNCTPTSFANGARATTGGTVTRTGAQIRAMIPQSEETDPSTPGWSLQDGDRAMTKLNVGFILGTGGWTGVLDALDRGQFVVLQGISGAFPNGTCSGTFDGAHAVGIHPDVVGPGLALLADPICPARRIESLRILRNYASAFRQSIAFGYFGRAVPIVAPPKPITPKGWVQVEGAYWQYTVQGTPTIGYAKTTRVQRLTKGYSGNIDRVADRMANGDPVVWGGRERMFGRLMAPSAYAGKWVDLLDEPNVRYIDK